MSLPPVKDLATMRGSMIFTLLKEILRDEADRIRNIEDALVKHGAYDQWDESRGAVHHALCAWAEVIDRWEADARKAEANLKAGDDKKRPHSLVLASADIARSALIGEITKLQGAPRAA